VAARLPGLVERFGLDFVVVSVRPEAHPELLAQLHALGLAVLCEMFSCGFSLATDDVAEPLDGPSAAFLRDQARANDIWVCGSVPELAEGATVPHNVAILAAPDGRLHRYRKIHPFSYAREDEAYAAGDQFVTVDVEGCRVSLFVCYDLRFADEFWGLAPTTDCYVVVANWPETRRHHWRSLLVARAIENQAYVVGVNRVGEGDGLRYVGDSRIVDPLGEVLGSAAGTEALVVAEVDPAQVTAVRERFPFLADRR